VKQALQRVRPAPPKVKRLMEVANCVPPEAELPDYFSSEAFERFVEGSSAAADFEFTVAKYFEQFGSKSYKGLLDFIRATRPTTVSEAVLQYMYVRNVRELLRKIASVKKDSTKISLPALGSLEFVQASIDKQGKIRFEVSSILRDLEGVEISRIRQCLICKKIFWAGRKDKYACTSEHQNLLRVRRHREERDSRNKKWREGYLSGYKRQRLKKRENSEKERLN
jgi:hypothetical protein